MDNMVPVKRTGDQGILQGILQGIPGEESVLFSPVMISTDFGSVRMGLSKRVSRA
jgi:hypothetical protein